MSTASPTAPGIAPSAVLSVRPVVLPATGRGTDLHVRVTAPTTGTDHPVVVLSHGFSHSMDAYLPLAEHWASHGFAVVQPTHLDALVLGLAPDDPRTPRIWRQRIADLVAVLDGLDHVEEALPGPAGRLDRDRIAVAGHSYGATSASALLGARVLGPAGDGVGDLADARVRAGVLLSVPGTGGADLAPFAAEAFPFMHPGFDAMATPALVVAGAEDRSPLTTRGPDWFTDAFRLSPGEKALLTVTGAGHALGGIEKDLGVPETPAEDLGQVRLVHRASTAFLRQALGLGDEAWTALQADLAAAGEDALGRLETT